MKSYWWSGSRDVDSKCAATVNVGMIEASSIEVIEGRTNQESQT